MRTINKAILHCDASSNPNQDSIESVRDLHTSPKTKAIKWGEYDTHGKGWGEVGYHFYIQSDGTLQYGRSIDKKGAHCIGHNHESIGICMHGVKKSDFNNKQKLTLYRLLNSLVMIFPDMTIHGHNEFANKACPVYDVEPFKMI
jgi:N-acetylmuramoyl-L-alanine amidase